MRKYFIAAALIQGIWGITPSASKIVIQYIPVELYAALRFSVASLVFLSVSMFVTKSFKLKNINFLKLALIGIATYAFTSLGTLYGLQLGGVTNFSFASSMGAIITAVVSILVLREKRHKYFMTAAALSIGGGMLLFWGKLDISGFEIAAASLLLIWAGYTCEALGFVYSKKFKDILSMTEYIGVMQIFAALFMWLVFFLKDTPPVNFAVIPLQAYLAFTFVALISCCLCYFVLYWLLNHVEGHRLAFFDCFHTLVSSSLGLFLFQEAFNLKMALGGVCLIGAVLLITRPS